MKCRAMRIGGVDSASDIEDIKLLAREIGIASSKDAMTIFAKRPRTLYEVAHRVNRGEQKFDTAVSNFWTLFMPIRSCGRLP